MTHHHHLRATARLCWLAVILCFFPSFFLGCTGQDRACRIDQFEYKYISVEQLDASNKQIKEIQLLAKGGGLFSQDLYYYLALGPYTRSARVEVMPDFVLTLEQNKIYQLPTFATKITDISFLRCYDDQFSSQRMRSEGMAVEKNDFEPGGLYLLSTRENEKTTSPRVTKMDYVGFGKLSVPSIMALPDGREITGADPEISKYGRYHSVGKNGECPGKKKTVMELWINILVKPFPAFIELCDLGVQPAIHKGMSHVPWEWFRDKYIHPKPDNS